jgi:glycosyltransferase involved in cell wall biosynthesis
VSVTHQLAIIGPLSPPFGGVSAHLDRFLPYLDRAGIDYIVYNTAGATEIPGRAVSVASKKKAWFLRYLVCGREPVIYLHNDQWPAWALTWFLRRIRRKRVVICFHSETVRTVSESRGRIIRWLMRRGIRSADQLVAVSQRIRDFLLGMGGLASRTIVAPAFIPPTAVSPAEEQAAIHPSVKVFCEQHSPVILATGAGVMYKQTTDLYGIDMTIELVDHLRGRYPRIGVLWFLLDFIGSSPEYAEKMRQEVTRRKLDNHWLFASPQKLFYPFYGLADLLVRPTCTDGDAVTIRESLHYGVPAVASDATTRPDGTILFRTRDQADYEQAVRRTVENLPAERERLRQRPTESSADQVVEVLREVVGGASG